MAPRVIGVRHGEVHNPRHVIYAGLPDYVLSEVGREHARAAAERLRSEEVVAVYASPLDRAVETAAAIAEVTGAEVRIDDRLHEWHHWTRWAGLTWDELRDNGTDAFERYVNDPGSVTDEESLDQLADRMSAWLQDVCREHASGVVVGVSHLEPLRALILRLEGRPWSELFEVDIPTGGAVELWPAPSSVPDAQPEV